MYHTRRQVQDLRSTGSLKTGDSAGNASPLVYLVCFGNLDDIDILGILTLDVGEGIFIEDLNSIKICTCNTRPLSWTVSIIFDYRSVRCKSLSSISSLHTRGDNCQHSHSRLRCLVETHEKGTCLYHICDPWDCSL